MCIETVCEWCGRPESSIKVLNLTVFAFFCSSSSRLIANLTTKGLLVKKLLFLMAFPMGAMSALQAYSQDISTNVPQATSQKVHDLADSDIRNGWFSNWENAGDFYSVEYVDGVKER